jgi:site-specific recombinase XerD
VANRVSGASRKTSTLGTYQSKWKKFQSWCKEAHVTPADATDADLADFLCYLFHQGLAVSTLRMYLSAVSQTLRQLGGADLSASPVLSQLIRSFLLERPTSLKRFPDWDLSLVLRSLLSHPYEPLKTADFRWLSYKTLFLVMLGSARRRSEIHALDARRVAWKADYSEVLLYPVPGFLPKILATAEGGERFQPIRIPALTNLIGPSRDEPDRLLCPVRALRQYLNRSKTRRSGTSRLFISLQAGRDRDLHPNTLASWVKEVIRYAYWRASRDKELQGSIRVHELRSLGASLAVQATFSLDSVLQACTWKEHSTFSSHYLRDLTHIQGQLHTLGPIVAAGQVAKF